VGENGAPYAVTKFHVLDEEYTTQCKAHKQLSVEMALEGLAEFEDVSARKLGEYKKQDDIADAINMLRASIRRNLLS
jgi:DNA-binding transcriptional regulator of glucitol operon